MSETQEWVPLEGPALLAAVRDILIANPERHDQSLWVGNYYAEEDIREHNRVPVDDIRRFMLSPIPDAPETAGEVPPCGTKGCFYGWAGVLSAPSGSYLTDGRIYLPNGDSYFLPDWVSPRLGFTPAEAMFMYSTARTRKQLIDILNARITDPKADIRAVVYPPLT